MGDTYIFQLIKSLSVKERVEFSIFLDSKYSNRSKFQKNMKPLLVLILKELEKPADMSIAKEALYKKMFPGEAFTEGRLEKNFTELGKLVRRFLLDQRYCREENLFFQQLDWANILRQRGIDTRYLYIISQLDKLLNENYYQTTEYYLKRFLLEEEIHEWESIHSSTKDDRNLPEVLFALGQFYYLNRLELVNRLLLQRTVTQVKEENFLLKEVNVPVEYLQRSPILEANLKIFRLLNADKPDFSGYAELSDFLKEHEHTIELEVLKEMYTFLTNLCTIFVNFGHVEMLPVLFDLNKEVLKRGYYYYDGKIAAPAFSNIVNSALKTGNVDWALQFMDEHRFNIIGEKENTEEFYRLSKASYYFSVGKFEQAMDWIPDAPKDTTYMFRARRLRLKIYYELDSALLLYELDAFKMVISRAAKSVISIEFRELQVNFVNFLYQITRTARHDKARFLLLAEKITAKPFVSEKDWLLDIVKRNL
jgi:hypothetical protein